MLLSLGTGHAVVPGHPLAGRKGGLCFAFLQSFKKMVVEDVPSLF